MVRVKLNDRAKSFGVWFRCSGGCREF